MPIYSRPFVAFGAMFACAWIPAGPAHATSPLETARAQERFDEPMVVTDTSQGIPESPLAVGGPLGAIGDLAAGPGAMGAPPLQIQLGAAESAPHRAGPIDLPFDISLQGM